MMMSQGWDIVVHGLRTGCFDGICRVFLTYPRFAQILLLLSFLEGVSGVVGMMRGDP